MIFLRNEKGRWIIFELELEVYRVRFGGGEFALFGLGCLRDCLPFQQQRWCLMKRDGK